MTYREAKRLIKTLKNEFYWIMALVDLKIISEAQACRLIKESES